jgi:hypothetical protein
MSAALFSIGEQAQATDEYEQVKDFLFHGN